MLHISVILSNAYGRDVSTQFDEPVYRGGRAWERSKAKRPGGGELGSWEVGNGDTDSYRHDR
jgi:hypothetical protein